MRSRKYSFPESNELITWLEQGRPGKYLQTIMDNYHSQEIMALATSKQDRMVDLLERLVRVESPSTEREVFSEVFDVITGELGRLSFEAIHHPGKRTGGYVVAKPRDFEDGKPAQLLLGHCDTVWPTGTLNTMPFSVDGNVIGGPGVFDMKGGLTQMIFALDIISDLGIRPKLAPIVFVNSDEETGSVESGEAIAEWARQVERVFVMEPALGSNGKLKTARKGVSQYKIHINGKAAHAGLDPEKGISAVKELAYVIDQLYALENRENGIGINVGVVKGGLRPNVIAPYCLAEIDVRVSSVEDAQIVESAIIGLEPTTPGISFSIEQEHGKPPMERTGANQRLWQKAYEAGRTIGLQLEHATAGGGSDGNTTSQYAATLDGLGAVGDGAHAAHEHLFLDKMVERTALLALLILSPGD